MSRLLKHDVRLRNAFSQQCAGRVTVAAPHSLPMRELEEARLLQLELYDSLGRIIGGGAAWAANLELLRAFVGEHRRLPKHAEAYRDVKLGSWCTNQRTAKKGQGTGKLTPEQVAQLEAIPG